MESYSSNIPDTTSRGLAAVLTQFGVPSPAATTRPTIETETIDFTYVNICDEDEIDIVLADEQYDEEDGPSQAHRGDILTILLSGGASDDAHVPKVVEWMEQANQAAAAATDAKKDGNLQTALDSHAASAKLFRNAAAVLKEQNGKNDAERFKR